MKRIKLVWMEKIREIEKRTPDYLARWELLKAYGNTEEKRVSQVMKQQMEDINKESNRLLKIMKKQTAEVLKK